MLLPNYAFNPIAELALRPNQTIVPQRVNAALGVRMKISAIVLVPLGICGLLALAMPHYEQVVPAVVGKITVGGAPLKGAAVYVIAPYNTGECIRSTDSAVTDSEGVYSVSGRREVVLFGYFLRKRDFWAVCIDFSGELAVLSALQGLEIPDHLEISCEIGYAESSPGSHEPLCDGPPQLRR